MIMRTRRQTPKTSAQAMVMRSRFFSTMLVPVWLEYMELAIISLMPVPLPECSMMKTMRPTPEAISRTSMRISRKFKVIFFQRLKFL